jgi:hypothetical protein
MKKKLSYKEELLKDVSMEDGDNIIVLVEKRGTGNISQTSRGNVLEHIGLVEVYKYGTLNKVVAK